MLQPSDCSKKWWPSLFLVKKKCRLFKMMQRVTSVSFATGDPPLLRHYLQEGLGITIKRKKMQPVVKRPLKVSIDLKWKVRFFLKVFQVLLSGSSAAYLCQFVFHYHRRTGSKTKFQKSQRSPCCQENHVLLRLRKARWPSSRKAMRKQSRKTQSSSFLLRYDHVCDHFFPSQTFNWNI